MEVDNEKPKDRDFEMYQILIQARNFHYDNFNKWASYFYFAIGALFVGFYSVNAPNSHQASISEMDFRPSILVLGFIVSLLWYWSCKGYYYWNINWITLVNEYEEKILKLNYEKRVYFVFANKNSQNNYSNPLSGANISTSKIAILFAFIVTTIWGILLLEQLGSRHLIKFGVLRYAIELLVSMFCIIFVSALLPWLDKKWPKYSLVSKTTHFEDLRIIHKDKEA